MNRLISLLLITLSFSSFGQNFLDKHVGTYRGQLYFCFPKHVDSVEFELTLASTGKPDCWKQTIHFLYPEKNANDKIEYNIRKDSLFNDDLHFLREEKDGIVTTETRIGNTFYTNYIDDHMSFDVQTTFEGSYVDYQLNGYSGPMGEESTSKPDGENPQRSVYSFPLMVVQKARLYKQKTE
ncbi:MAG: hypothetical protein V4604_07690 [Bacteroidota bacterium]